MSRSNGGSRPDQDSLPWAAACTECGFSADRTQKLEIVARQTGLFHFQLFLSPKKPKVRHDSRDFNSSRVLFYCHVERRNRSGLPPEDRSLRIPGRGGPRPLPACPGGGWTLIINGGTNNWSAGTNWLSGTVPGAAGDTANFTLSLTGATTVNLDTAQTVGTLNIVLS